MSDRKEKQKYKCTVEDILVYSLTFIVGLALVITSSIYGYKGCTIYGSILIVFGALALLYYTKDIFFKQKKVRCEEDE